MAQGKEVKPEEKAEMKKSRDRSPSYPAMSLKVSIDRMVAFDKYFGRHSAPVDKAALAWGMKAKSSQAFSTLAALKSFGLIGYGDGRTAALSTDGRNYLRAQQDSVKQEILGRCALKPKAISTYWAKWGADRPPDPICLDELVLKGDFNQNAAPAFLKVYDDTIAYAGLANSDKIELNKNRHGDNVVSKPETPDCEREGLIEVGDLVQWEASGVLRMEKPSRVRAIQEHEGASWVFVDGSETGIPMEEIVLEQKGEKPKSGLPPFLPLPTAAEAGSVRMSGTEREWLRGPLSKDTNYRLIVSGDLGPKEIAKLIKMLEAQKQILSEDDADQQ